MSMAQIDVETTLRIHTVPMHMAKTTDSKQGEYKPLVLSLGPYHHGKPEYSQMEEFKKGVFVKFIEESVKKATKNDERYFHYKICQKIDEIRGNYPRIDKNIKDDALARIILNDACFLISYMDRSTSTFTDVIDKLGLSTAVFVECDLWRLENQIPFWIIKFLIYLRFGEADGDRKVQEYFSHICFKDSIRLEELPWKKAQRIPLHLLDAYRTILLTRTLHKTPNESNEIVATNESSETTTRNAGASAGSTIQSMFEKFSLPHRPVTYLRAKGIIVRPSSCCLKDIKFRSYCVFGKLRIPILLVDHKTEAFFHNVVALEMSPGCSADTAIISYIDFMKSLIDTSKDVRMLRDRGILFSTLGSDEEVVKVFKGIETYGMTNAGIFEKVRTKINDHCSSKAKTWVADLYQNYLRSPWSVVAICATIFLLCLTFLQTYYTMHPLSKD